MRATARMPAAKATAHMTATESASSGMSGVLRERRARRKHVESDGKSYSSEIFW
jgi:hypothetical protein